MKKITSIVLSVSMAAGALGMNTAVVHAEESAKKVAYISAANQFDFFVYIGAEIKKVGEENGVQVDMFDAALDVSKEADLMSQAILQKYDAIIVGPVDTQALIPSIKEANDAGIPVINYDSFIEGAEVYARVGSGNKEMGKTAGEYAADMLKEKYGEVKGNVIVLSYPALETMNQRNEGFIEALKEYPDKIIVLKDGEKVAELNTEETNEKEVIRLMVGREYSDFYQRERKCHGDVCLELKDISGVKEGMLNNAYIPQHVSFKVEEGEVLGVAGLVGAGRTELVRMIFGEMPIGSGEIFVQGEKVQIKSSRDAIKLGMAWVTEDRKQEGLILEDTLVRNLSLPTVHKHRKAGIIDDNFLTKMSEEYIQKLKVKTTGGQQKAKNLSGGNQQKIVLGKWLSTNPKILILDEPTRGIDVGAKAEIYKLINELTAQGMAIVLISSELPEVMGMSDRLLIMYEGRVTGQLLKEEYTEERVMEYATGRKVHNE